MFSQFVLAKVNVSYQEYTKRVPECDRKEEILFPIGSNGL